MPNVEFKVIVVDWSASVSNRFCSISVGELVSRCAGSRYTKSIYFCYENDYEVLQRWQRRLLFALWSPELLARSPTASFTRWQLVHLEHTCELLFRLPLDMYLERTR